MNTQEIKIRRWFWPWQDEVEEHWLEEMAHKGLHFHSVTRWGSYTFQSGEPRDMVYRLDYQYKNKQSMDDYFQLFQDAGWEYVGMVNAWYYFRKPRVPGETNEIFTDNASKIAKYRRVMATFFIVAILVSTSITNLTTNTLTIRTESPVLMVIRMILLVFLSLAAFFVGYFMLRIYQRIKKLR